MKYIGAHVSSAGGVDNAPIKANELGARAFACFTKNHRTWASPTLDPEKIKAFRNNCDKYGFDSKHILPHDTYLINLGHPGRDELQKSRLAFIDEMHRCELLGLSMLNFHPGSSLKLIDDEECLTLIAQSINMALDSTKGVTAVIENTAGQGSNLGYSFEQIKFIIDLVHDKNRVGVCLDTCHTFAAGYELVTPEGYTETFRQFDTIIGFGYLKALHLNDTKKGLGSHVDRHENLGKGFLGLETFRRIVNDRNFEDMPLIIETPGEEFWKEDITLLYSFIDVIQ